MSMRTPSCDGVGAGTALRALGPSLLVLMLASCADPAGERATDTARRAIIDGDPAPELTGVVHLRHPQSSLLCSGVVVAPTLVLTAAHCAFRDGGEEAEPLEPAGFRVGFGPDTESLEFVEAAAVTWVGAPDAIDVTTTVAAGEDVAVLTLAEPAPPGTLVHAVDLDYYPALDHSYTLAGYGLSSLETWDSGTKRATEDAFVGLDPPTGIVQTYGQGACNGDSGGPLLLGPDLAVVGVISQIGADEDETACTMGATFASTTVNPAVSALIEDALDSLPPCAERDEICANGQDENCSGEADEGCAAAGAGGAGGETAPSAGGDEDDDVPAVEEDAGAAAATPSEGGADEVSGSPEDVSSDPYDCDCRASRRSSGDGLQILAGLAILAFRWRRRARR